MGTAVNSSYRDPAEGSVWCVYKHQHRPLITCLDCGKFSKCEEANTPEAHSRLMGSLFVNKYVYFTKMRKRMYLFKKLDGSTVPAPAGFNPDAPDLAMLEDVAEVLVINHVLVKQVKLVKKSVQERKEIRSEASVTREEPKPVAKTRKKRSA